MSDRRHRVKASRAATLLVVLVALIGHVAFSLALEGPALTWRDPEYGYKLRAIRERIRENPEKPLVVVLGSSRVAMGFKADELAGEPQLVFNAALIGAGPLMELLMLKRLLADGIQPAAVLVEVWPPFLYEEGPYCELYRLGAPRLCQRELRWFDAYAEEGTKIRRDWLWARLSPISAVRYDLMSRTMPGWLAHTCRRDFSWAPLDGWGWLPGLPPETPEHRQKRLAAARQYYAPLLVDLHCSPLADRALRELFDICRSAGIPATLLQMPESSEFRAMYTPSTQERANACIAQIQREYDLPFINCREWMQDECLSDGFHLSQAGAKEFTLRFAREGLPLVRGGRMR